MSSQENLGVAPKFGSFKPSVASTKLKAISSHRPSAEPLPEDNATEGHPRRRHRSVKHEDTARRHHEYGRARRSHRRLDDYQKPIPSINENPHNPVIAAWDEGPSLYIADWKGDTENTIYGRPHQYHVPSYRRQGAGGVLGYDTNIRIDRYTSDERSLVMRNTESPYHSTKNENLLSTTVDRAENKRRKFIGPTQEDEGLDRVADFIRLSSKKRKRSSSYSDSEFQNDMRLDYRTIADAADSWDELADSDAETMSGPSDSGNSGWSQEQESLSRVENARLSRLVKEEPYNVAAWIQLIDHQDLVIGRGQKIPHMKASEKHALSQIKITLCEDALKSVGNDARGAPHRETMFLRLVEEGSQIWDCETAARKWQEILKKTPSAISLKLRHLDFCQSEPSVFHYDGCRTAMLGALEQLSQLQDSELIPQGARDNSLEETQVYLFLRLTVLMRESGYQEYALALWQGAIEFYLFRPTIFADAIQERIPKSNLLKYFEDFWDEEVPRFGEPNAHGWCSFHQTGGIATTRNADHLDPSIDTEDCFTSFVETELQLMRALAEPGRTSDETGSNDPYHVILSSDITSVLSLLPYSMDYHLLIDGLTCFCQLPPMPNLERPTSRHWWWLDPFLRNYLLENATGPESATIHADRPLLDHGLLFVQTSTQSLFSRSGMPQVLSLPTNWIRLCLESLTSALPQHDSLAEYQLAFEYHHNPTNAKRTAKNLLKKRSSSLRLWNAYGLGEYHVGHMEAADNVISTALRMSETLNQANQGDAILLCQSWIWNALRQTNLDLALVRTVTMGKSSSRATTARSMDINDKAQEVLEAHEVLERQQLNCLTTGQHERFVAVTECLALLAYLPETSLANALLVYQSTLDLLASWKSASTPVTERIHQERAHLIAYHISGAQDLDSRYDNRSSTTRVFQRAWLHNPHLIRKTLQQSLGQFPDNTIILNAYSHNELRFPITERESALSNFSRLSLTVSSAGPPDPTSTLPSVLGGELNESKSGEPSIVRYFHSIVTYVSRIYSQPDERSATIYRARSLFQRAVASRSGKHSAGLWAFYLRFEIHVAGTEGDLEKARAVFYQGLRMVPWCKAFAMLAFTGLRRSMTKELKGVWQTMVERELRLYVDLEPVFEQMEKRG